MRQVSLRKIRVVVADDNAAFQRKLTSILEAEFDVVAVATDGKSALDLIQANKPDLAILDLAMPKLNGIEVTRELRKSRQNLTIVICSLDSDCDVVKAAQEAGASAYVFKIRIEEDLIKDVKSALEAKPFV